MKPAPSLLTPQASFSIWAPFALCQNLTIPYTDLFQSNSGRKGCSLLSLASGCQSCLPVGRGFLALPALIYLLQAERVAGTWQQERPHHVQTPKLAREAQVPLATGAMTRKGQRNGRLHGSWKPPRLCNEKSRREEPSTDFQCRAPGKKRHVVVMLSSKGVWILSCEGEVQWLSPFLLCTVQPEARGISPELRGPRRCKVRRGLSS